MAEARGLNTAAMIVTLVWSTTHTGTLEVRSRWAGAERSPHTGWTTHARKVDLARGTKDCHREHEAAERVQCRVNCGEWIEAGEIGEDDATLTLSL